MNVGRTNRAVIDFNLPLHIPETNGTVILCRNHPTVTRMKNQVQEVPRLVVHLAGFHLNDREAVGCDQGELRAVGRKGQIKRSVVASVFIDAECAWYGDPAFDLCFCLKHFFLKCLWTPASAKDFLTCFRAFVAAYLDGVDWEPVADFERRAATLLPGLFLARVDGKSPAEYLTDEADKDKVRRVAREFLKNPTDRLETVVSAWEREVGG